MPRILYQEKAQRDSWWVKVSITATLLAYMASSGILLAYVAGGGNKFSLMFQSQAGKSAAIILWSFLFMYFTLCGGAQGGEGKKSSAVQFAHKKYYRNIAIGFFVLMIALIQFGNPLLALLYLGDDGVHEFINKKTDGSSGDIQYTLSADTAFKVVGAINCYGAGFGAALIGYAVAQRCNRNKS